MDAADVIILASPVYVYHATAAGIRSTLKDMADSLFFWGVARIYKYGLCVAATNWNGVSMKKKAAIDKKITAIAKQIASRHGRVNPGLKAKGMFYIMHMMQRKG